MAEQNPIAVTEDRVKTWLTVQAQDLAGFAVRKYNAEALLKSALLVIFENKDLRAAMATDIGRASIRNALRRAATLGLSLNPQEGKACIVAYNGKKGLVVQYQIMKDGYIELAHDTGNVKLVKIDTVYENDTFEGPTTTDHGDEFRFTPARRDRGKIDGFFASMTLNDGTAATKYITVEQAADHRKKYSPYSELGEKEYGEKTIAKMLCKSARVASVVPMIEIADRKDQSEEIPDPGSENDRTEKGTAPEDIAEKLADPANPAPAPAPESELDIF